MAIVLTTIAISTCSASGGVAQINTDPYGRAVRGYDAVAFFINNAALQGDPAFEHEWNGAKWIFANAENLERFKQNPEAYTPQFGGYCSYAVSHGYTADGDPSTWKIVDGKLYLNYNQNARSAWESEQEKNIKAGEENWKVFKTKKPQHKG